MAIKIGINGYGRIGRNMLRAIHELGRTDEFDVVAINDLGDANTNAHLTRRDTAHGPFPGTVVVEGDDERVVRAEHGEATRKALIDQGRPDRVVVASVVSDREAGIAAALGGEGRSIRWLRSVADTPWADEGYPELGIDRLCGAKGAFARFGPCVLVDVGTALTFNVMGHDGQFAGGVILPGPTRTEKKGGRA